MEKAKLRSIENTAQVRALVHITAITVVALVSSIHISECLGVFMSNNNVYTVIVM